MPVVIPRVEQQKSFDCGSSACLAVLEAFGVTTGRKGMKAILGTTPLDGTDPRAVEAFLRRVGLEVQSGSMTLDDLLHHTRLGRAVVCCVTHNGGGHYVVVSRVRGGYVYRMCPASEGHHEPTASFLARWADVAWNGAVLRRWGIAAWRA